MTATQETNFLHFMAGCVLSISPAIATVDAKSDRAYYTATNPNATGSLLLQFRISDIEIESASNSDAELTKLASEVLDRAIAPYMEHAL